MTMNPIYYGLKKMGKNTYYEKQNAFKNFLFQTTKQIRNENMGYVASGNILHPMFVELQK